MFVSILLSAVLMTGPQSIAHQAEQPPQHQEVSEELKDVCKEKNFFGSREEGWFWHNECLKKIRKAKQFKTIPEKVVIPWDMIDKLDPDEIAKLEETSRKIAVMYPTTENIAEYRKLLTYISEKVWNFTKADLLYRTGSSQYAALEPYVGSDFRTEQWRAIKRQERAKVLEKYRDRAGLIILYREGCPACEKQRRPMEVFQEKWKWSVKWVDADVHINFASRMGTELVPDILLVLNRNGKPVIDRVASGMTTVSEIEDGIFYSLYRLGEVKDEDIIFK